MVRAKKNAFKRVRWSTSMRQTLCCMFRFFVNKGHEEAFERVFSQRFRRNLQRQYGKDENLPIRTLNTQWTWMRKTKSPVWKHVHIDTEFRLDAEWRSIIRKIKSTANYLNITLVEREEDAYCDTSMFDDFHHTAHLPEHHESVLTSDESSDDASTSTQRESPDVAFSERRENMAPHEDTENSNSIQMEPGYALLSHANQGSLLDCQAPINHDTEPITHGHGKVCFWCYQESELLANAKKIDHLQIPKHSSGLAPPEPEQALLQSLENQMDLSQNAATEGLPGLCSKGDLPRLLYRWSNSESQGTNTATLFESGMFKNRPGIYLPKAISKHSFLEHFKNHVTKAQVATPFISTFAQPLAPIHRAIHQQKHAIVSIIDTSKLSELGIPVFKASELVPMTDTATFCWRGYGEYEVWGRIPAAAIVCTFPITALENICYQGIEKFLQLEIIKKRNRCNRYLYTDLARELPPNKGKEYRPILERLAGRLGVPEGYWGLVAEGFEVAWTMGYRWLQSEDFRSPDKGNAATILPQVAPEYDSDNSSFRPPPSESGSYVTSSSSDDNTSSSESVEETYPRRDTPSDGFSVDDDSSVCSGQEDVEVFAQPRPRATALLTPPSTHRPRKKRKHIPKGAVPFKANSFAYLSKQSNAQESDWPSDDAYVETPIRSRFFPIQRINEI